MGSPRFTLLLTQGERSCEGIFPFTLNVPSRKLKQPVSSGYLCMKRTRIGDHLSLLRPTLDISIALLRTQSSRIICASECSSPRNPAQDGERRSSNGRLMWRRSSGMDVTAFGQNTNMGRYISQDIRVAMVECFSKYGFSQLKCVVDEARLITELASTSISILNQLQKICYNSGLTGPLFQSPAFCNECFQRLYVTRVVRR